MYVCLLEVVVLNNPIRTQLCINTAIVYMHRFYVFHSFTHFHKHTMAAAALFLAAKVEEQPRKLEHVIKVTQICLQRGELAGFNVRSEVRPPIFTLAFEGTPMRRLFWPVVRPATAWIAN